ncbi:MAG TPA: sigma-70 family RNA polymerase sigma factor [Gemmatimonadales bacterium]|nr:sigma-70 family RNA polymerase sigma factor [Gemmatimonadales bacterium]
MTLHSLHAARAHVVDDTSFEEAFRVCYAARFAPLFSYVDRLTGDPDLAADVAQEAFVRLHRRGEMPDQPAGWLVAVANNLVRDERRRVTRQLRLLTEEPTRAPAGAPPGDPSVDLERAERITAVRAALDRLNLRDRQALLLRHGGYSYREIAAALGLAETSVGTTLVRASQAFRAAFQEMHDAPE